MRCIVPGDQGRTTLHMKEIKVQQFRERMTSNRNIVVLDVRKEEEYQEHIKGAQLLPVDEISPTALEERGIKKNDEIILYCGSGRRSTRAQEILTSLGYTNVKSLQGGIMQWKDERLPTEK
jgi:phage shock protein E